MNSSLPITSKYLATVTLAGCLGITTALYFIRSRRKTKMYITQINDIPSGEETTPEEENIAALDEKDNDISNIGFGTDPSWFRKDAIERTDLMHTGSKGGKLVVVMVGLPGSGKTFMSRKISRFLRWISYRTRVFSLAKYRLEKLGTKSADFFDPENEAHCQTRVELMMSALEDAMRYLRRDGEIAIIDGANTSKYRRDLIRDRVSQEDGFDILWIENLIDPDIIITRNSAAIHNSPDFTNDEDFIKRMEHYQKSYETVLDAEGSYIKRFDSGDRIHLHGIQGFLRTKISSFVMNVHTYPRTIYMVRSGETDFIRKGLIGGDSPLTAEGIEFSQALANFFETDDTGFSVAPTTPGGLYVWSSTLQASQETAKKIKTSRYVEWRALRNIESGVCDGLSYEQIKARYPQEYKARQLDKLRYRYPRGESYVDVITRLEPVIFEAERETQPLVIVGHLAVLRCLYAYFLDLPMEELPYITINLNTVIRLDPKAYGCKERRVKIVRSDEADEVYDDYDAKRDTI